MSNQGAEKWFDVTHLDVERLLHNWRWLCKGPMVLLARNSFGDLFLRDETGRVLVLDVAGGKLKEIAESEGRFRELAVTLEKQEEWFAEADTLKARDRGLEPNSNQCSGFSTPLVFAQSGSNNKPYVVDLYEHVSFLGDLHQQISDLPDGAKVQLRIGPKP